MAELKYWKQKWLEVCTDSDSDNKWYIGGAICAASGKPRIYGYLKEYEQAWLMGYDDVKGDIELLSRD